MCKGLVAISLISLRKRRRKGVREHASILWLMNTALWRALRRPIVKDHCLAACCHGNTLTLAAGLKCCSQKWQMLCQERKKWEKKGFIFTLTPQSGLKFNLEDVSQDSSFVLRENTHLQESAKTFASSFVYRASNMQKAEPYVVA